MTKKKPWICVHCKEITNHKPEKCESCNSKTFEETHISNRKDYSLEDLREIFMKGCEHGKSIGTYLMSDLSIFGDKYAPLTEESKWNQINEELTNG